MLKPFEEEVERRWQRLKAKHENTYLVNGSNTNKARRRKCRALFRYSRGRGGDRTIPDERGGLACQPFCLTGSPGRSHAACRMNVYDFAYYGALWWDDNEKAEQESASALALAGYEDDSGWDALEVREERLKLFNVKPQQ